MATCPIGARIGRRIACPTFSILACIPANVPRINAGKVGISAISFDVEGGNHARGFLMSYITVSQPIFHAVNRVADLPLYGFAPSGRPASAAEHPRSYALPIMSFSPC